MKKIICLLLVLVTVFLLTACTFTVPIAVTSNTVGSKTGVATADFLDGSFFDEGADAGIAAAAKNGGITKISTVDMTFIVEAFPASCKIVTRVTGE